MPTFTFLVLSYVGEAFFFTLIHVSDQYVGDRFENDPIFSRY